MANTIITSKIASIETLRVLHNTSALIQNVNRDYQKVYSEMGVKVGTTVNLRIPATYYYTKGQSITVQGTTETYVPVTLNTQGNIAFEFSSVELATAIEKFSERYLTPIAARIATGVDVDGFVAALPTVFHQVGTPGTTPGTSGGSGLLTTTAPQIVLNAGVQMTNMATPTARRRVALNPAAGASVVAALTNVFNPAETIAEQYISGRMGRALNFTFLETQNIPQLLTGTHGGTGQVNGNNQTGSALVTSGWTANQTVLKAGEVFTIAGVNEVNPENQNTTGNLAQFVVTSDVTADASGNATINIAPSLIPTGATVSNGTVDVSPVTGALLTLQSGSASTKYPVNMAFHKDAFTLVTADLPMPEGAEFAAREVYDDVSLRIWKDRDINSDSFPCRVDVLYGWATPRPQLACKIAG
jgi:hypothetical protein